MFPDLCGADWMSKTRGMRKLIWPCEYAGFYSKNPKLHQVFIQKMHQVYSAADDFVAPKF